MPLDIKRDERGVLYEAFTAGTGQVFIITINPGFTRGNHYHKRKTEKFLVIEGSAHIVCRNRETNVTTTVFCTADKPHVITVTPNNTHRITSMDGCTIVCYVSELFDEADPDTYPEET